MNWKDELRKILDKYINSNNLGYKNKEEDLICNNILFVVKISLNKDTHLKKRPKEIFFTNITINIPTYLNFYELKVTLLRSNEEETSQFTSFFEDEEEKIRKDKEKVYESLCIYIDNCIGIREKKYYLDQSSEIKRTEKPALEPIKTEIKKPNKIMIFICRLRTDKYIDVRKSVESQTLKNFNSDFKDLSRCIFAYWYGDKSNIPNSLKNTKYSNSKAMLDDLKNDLYYYQIKFEVEDDTELIDFLTNKNARNREKGLEIIAKKNINYQYTDLFHELPDDCIMV